MILLHTTLYFMRFALLLIEEGCSTGGAMGADRFQETHLAPNQPRCVHGAPTLAQAAVAAAAAVTHANPAAVLAPDYLLNSVTTLYQPCNCLNSGDIGSGRCTDACQPGGGAGAAVSLARPVCGDRVLRVAASSCHVSRLRRNQRNQQQQRRQQQAASVSAAAEAQAGCRHGGGSRIKFAADNIFAAGEPPAGLGHGAGALLQRCRGQGPPQLGCIRHPAAVVAGKQGLACE